MAAYRILVLCLAVSNIATIAGEFDSSKMTPVERPTVSAPEWKWSGGKMPAIPELDAKFDPKDGLSSSRVAWGDPKSIALAQDGSLALASMKGLFVWRNGKLSALTGESTDANNKKVPGNSPLPYPWVNGVVFSDSGDVWSATGQGLFVLKTGEYRILKCDEKYNEGQTFECIYKRTNGKIVVGGRQCVLLEIDPKTEAVKQLYTDPGRDWITSITESPDGELWFTVINQGLFHYNGQTFEMMSFKQPWLPTSYVYSALIDSDRTKWIGCQEGLGFQGSDGIGQRVDPKFLPDPGAWQLAACKHGVLIGTRAGLVLYDTKSKDASPWRYGPIAPVSSFAVSPEGIVYIANPGSVITIDPHLFTSVNPRMAKLDSARKLVEASYPKLPDAPLMVAVDRENGVWLALDKELWHFDGKSWLDRSDLLGASEPSLLFQDSKKRTWLGTSGNGLIEISATPPRALNQIRHMMVAYIRAVTEHPNGSLYVGTGHGLFKLNGDAWTQLISGTDIFFVDVDSAGRVWCFSHDSGLYVLDGDTVRTVPDVPQLAGLGNDAALVHDSAGAVRIVWMRTTKAGAEQASVVLNEDIFKQSVVEPDVDALAKSAELKLRISLADRAVAFAINDQPKMSWSGFFRIVEKLGARLRKADAGQIQTPLTVLIPADLTMQDLNSAFMALYRQGFNPESRYADGKTILGDAPRPRPPTQKPPKEVTVYVKRQENEAVYDVDGKTVSSEDIDKILSEAQDKNVTVVISFDPGAHFGEVMKLVPLCLKAGYTDLAIRGGR